MASLNYETLNNIMAKYDTPFSWPESTCLHPAIDLVKMLVDPSPVLDPILSLSEARATARILKYYNGSWMNLILEYLGRTEYGRPVKQSQAQCGDIVELDAGNLPIETTISPHIKHPVGILANTDISFVRGAKGTIAVPMQCVRVIKAARIESCLRG